MSSEAFTCEHANPVRPAEPFTLDQCRLCWLAAQKGRWTKANLPCVYIGEAAGPKGYHTCEHPDEPLGAVTCSCKGCGVRCPGYLATAK